MSFPFFLNIFNKINKRVLFLYDDIKVGVFIHHRIYGYGEITTIDEQRQRAFVDFFKDTYGWFTLETIAKGCKILSSDKVFIKVRFGSNGDENIKDILKKYSDYYLVGIYFT